MLFDQIFAVGDCTTIGLGLGVFIAGPSTAVDREALGTETGTGSGTGPGHFWSRSWWPVAGGPE